MWAWGITGATRSNLRAVADRFDSKRAGAVSSFAGTTLRKLLIGGVASIDVLCAFQLPFREYPSREYEQFPLPPDYQEKTEWAFARLIYPPANSVHGRRYGGFYWDNWKTTDYPRTDRHLAQAMRRLTRLHVRSVEQPVDLDTGDQYNWPWI